MVQKQKIHHFRLKDSIIKDPQLIRGVLIALTKLKYNQHHQHFVLIATHKQKHRITFRSDDSSPRLHDVQMVDVCSLNVQEIQTAQTVYGTILFLTLIKAHCVNELY